MFWWLSQNKRGIANERESLSLGIAVFFTVSTSPAFQRTEHFENCFCFRLQVSVWEATTLLCPKERANPNRLTGDGNRSSFRNLVFRIPDGGQSPKTL
jgi:hypothetical protein